MNTPTRRSHAGFWIVIAILGLGLCLSVLANFGLLLGLAFMGGGSAPVRLEAEDEFPKLKETWSYGHGSVKAARIPVNGVIMRESDAGFFGVGLDQVEAVLRQIRSAQNDSAVKAIILEVDSPGGAITPTDEIYRALTNFKASGKDRKVVVLVQGMAASGGYYVAMASDWIIAEPTALIGSISVIIQTLNWKDLSDKLGIQDVTIKSGKNKDLLNPFREVNPEQLAMFQTIVDNLHQHFVDIVKKGRSLEESALQKMCDGSVFSATEAKQRHMIDQTGYWSDAVAKTAQLLGQSSVRVIRYEERSSFANWLAELRGPSLQLGLPRWLNVDGPRIMYLWRP